MKQRPFPVTILAILAGVAAVLSVYHLLQAIGILPYFIGPVAIRDFNLWYVIMWALMAWVYVWLVQMLWQMSPAAWIFLVVVSFANILLDFIATFGDVTFSDVAISFLINGLILLYALLPGTRQAFGTSSESA